MGKDGQVEMRLGWIHLSHALPETCSDYEADQERNVRDDLNAHIKDWSDITPNRGCGAQKERPSY